MRLKTHKMAMPIFPKFLTLNWNISRTISRIEVGDGSIVSIFHALSFDRNFFFRPEVPFKPGLHIVIMIVSTRPKYAPNSVPNNFDKCVHFDYNIASFNSIAIHCLVSSSSNDEHSPSQTCLQLCLRRYGKPTSNDCGKTIANSLCESLPA